MTKYLVIYEEENWTAHSGWNEATRIEPFEDEQEAIQFAIKHDGYIVQPASIQSKVVQE